MNNKEIFIKEIEVLIENMKDYDQGFHGLSEDAMKFLNNLKEKNDNGVKLTEKGRKIFEYMINNLEEQANNFSAEAIANGIFINPKSVGGSMRSLIKEGLVEKIGSSPAIYSITEKGEKCLI